MTNKELRFAVLSFLKPYKLRLIFGAISLVTVVSCMLMLGYSIKHFIDHGFGLTSNEAPIIHILVLTTIFGVASFFRSYIINSTAEFAANDVKRAAYTTLLSLDSKQIDEFSFADLSARINSDTDAISRVIIDSTSFFLRNAMTTIGGIVLMFLNSPKLSSIAFIVIAIITICASLLSRKVRSLAKTAEMAKAKTSSLVFETIVNNKVINAYSKQKTIENYFDKLNESAKQKIVERLKFRSIFFASVITSMLLTIGSIVWYGSLEVIAGNMSSGTLASFLFYSFMTATSFGGIMEMINDQQKNLANCERIFDILALSGSSTQRSKDRIKLGTKGFIELKNISYNYTQKDNTTKVISNLSLKLEIGKFTVITGHSGVGKTTLLQLIMGIYQFNDGIISISGKDYKNISPDIWGAKLAYVPQDNMLFSGTILENISFFDDNISLKEVDRILKGLDLATYISTLKDGVNTDLGSMATKISGGQKQRLAIARALLSKPDILILDETTSQLDEATEANVLDFIKNELSSRTVICVAHRRGAIDKADSVVSL